MISERRDRLVQRYLNGEMSSAEERNFLGRVSADPELERILRIEQAIDRTLHHDRAALPIDDREARTRMLGMLEKLSEDAGPAMVATGRVLGGMNVTKKLAAVMIGALFVGALLLMIGLDRSAEESPAPALPRTAPSVQQISPSTAVPPATALTKTESVNDGAPATATTAKPEPAPQPRAVEMGAPAREPATLLSTAKKETEHALPPADTLGASKPAPTIPVITRDSINLEMNIDTRKMGKGK